YHATGQHLGKFENSDQADAYAEALHNSQDRVIRGGSKDFTLEEMLAQAAQITDPRVRALTEERIKQLAEVRIHAATEQAAQNKSAVYAVMAQKGYQMTVDDLWSMPAFRALPGTEQQEAVRNVVTQGEHLKELDGLQANFDWAQQEHARTQKEQAEQD